MKFVLSLESVKVVFMKRLGISCVLLLCFAVAETIAQTLSPDMPKGTQLRYALADANGAITGYSIRTLESVESADGATIYTYNVRTTNPDGTAKEGMPDEKRRIKVTDDEIIRIIDFSDMVPKEVAEDEEVDVSVTGTYTSIPRNPRIVDLPDGELKAKIKAEGMGLTVKMKVCNRRIEGRETVSTDAGAFDCWRISEDIVVSVLLFKKRTTVVSWYADRVGLVRSESHRPRGEMSVTTLAEITYPQ